jgi:hypothetical protein
MCQPKTTHTFQNYFSKKQGLAWTDWLFNWKQLLPEK